ncbi:hypothetical protein [Sinomonas mesophila]|uniref:hypothetical protein n=1 Tax=Sinomonas mesophila TaxID=1531955 RepID=UPI001115AB87|nr:hypothetical protein [Sinomonas mesophila]
MEGKGVTGVVDGHSVTVGSQPLLDELAVGPDPALDEVKRTAKFFLAPHRRGPGCGFRRERTGR